MRITYLHRARMLVDDRMHIIHTRPRRDRVRNWRANLTRIVDVCT